MKLFRFSTAALSLLMAGALSAQAPQTPAAPQPAGQQPAPRATQPAQASDAAEITIVGCLAQAAGGSDYTLTVTPAPAASAAAGAAGAVPDATRAAAGEKPASDAARTAAAATGPKSYKITGIAADQLKGHVNHQVELKGRAAAAAPGQSASSAQEFRASSVKMLSTTCPPAK